MVGRCEQRGDGARDRVVGRGLVNDVRLDECLGLLVEEILNRLDRQRVSDSQWCRVAQANRVDASDGALLVPGEANAVEPEDVLDLPVKVGEPRVALFECHESRQQITAGSGEPSANGALGLLLVPLLAPFDDLRLERLLGGVGSEVVLADPLLADDQGITDWHQSSPPATTRRGRMRIC